MTHRWKAVLCMALTVILLLSGCSASQGTNPVIKLDKSAADEWENWGLTPDFSYEVRTVKPGIIVDPQGYETDGVKTAVLRGKRIPDTFSVIDRDSAEVVYTGTIQKRKIKMVMQYSPTSSLLVPIGCSVCIWDSPMILSFEMICIVNFCRRLLPDFQTAARRNGGFFCPTDRNL